MRIIVLILQLLFFLPMCFARLVAGDEGFYVVAARMVMEGKIPYRDFLFTQMPLFPYVYGPWMWVFGYSWYSARALSAVLASVIGLLVYERVKALCGLRFALMAVVIYATSGLVFAWFSLAKTYTLSTFLLFATYYLLVQGKWEKEWFRFFLAGVCFGLSVSSRLLFAPLVAVFGVYLYFYEYTSLKNGKGISFFILGVVLISLPHLYFILYHFDAYWFGNIKYHQLFTENSAGMAERARSILFQIMLGIKESAQLSGRQYALLFGASLAWALWCMWRKRKIDLALFIGATLCFLYFLLPYAYLQYFSVTIPFFVIGAIQFCHKLIEVKKGSIFVFLVLVLFYFGSVKDNLYRYTKSGEGVLWIGKNDNPEDKNIFAMEGISKRIDMITEEGDSAIALWPGYLLSTQATIYPGLENHFGLKVADKVGERERRRYHMLSAKEVCKTIRKGVVKVVVLPSGRYKQCFWEAVKEGDYKEVEIVHGVHIWRLSKVSPQLAFERRHISAAGGGTKQHMGLFKCLRNI